MTIMLRTFFYIKTTCSATVKSTLVSTLYVLESRIKKPFKIMKGEDGLGGMGEAPIFT